MTTSFDFERVRLEHCDLIHGIESLYQTLINLAWFEDGQIQRAPHDGSGKTPLATEQLLAAGVDRDTVALLRLLPLPTSAALSEYHAVGVRAVAFSVVVDYYDKGAETCVDDIRQFGIDDLGDTVSLPPWALLLFGPQDRDDRVVIYDLRNLSISVLSLYQPTVAELEAAARPAASVTQEWAEKFQSLEWVPWRTSDDVSFIEVRPRRFEAMIADSTSLGTRTQLNLLTTPPYGGGPPMIPSVDEAKRYLDEVNKARCNEYWARRLVFESSGWPDSFDKALCRQKIEDFRQGYEAVTDFRIHGFFAKQIGDRQHGGPLREFYRERAGQYALSRAS